MSGIYFRQPTANKNLSTVSGLNVVGAKFSKTTTFEVLRFLNGSRYTVLTKMLKMCGIRIKKDAEMMRVKLRVKGVLLDLDGTLVDSRDAYREAVEIAFKALGWKTVPASVVLEIPRRLELNLSINDLVDNMNVQRFLDLYLNAYYGATATKTRLMPKIEGTLKRLSEKAVLALVTMRHVPKEKVTAELENFGIAKFFRHVTTALDTSDPKPSPDALIKCAEKLGVQACECLVVGDSVADVRAGKSAGAKTAAVLSGIFSRVELESEKPDLILKSVNELPDFIE
ncbi:MAG: HAD family hydrolase [Candidatus Bathyarchaeia archaeon]